MEESREKNSDNMKTKAIEWTQTRTEIHMDIVINSNMVDNKATTKNRDTTTTPEEVTPGITHTAKKATTEVIPAAPWITASTGKAVDTRLNGMELMETRTTQKMIVISTKILNWSPRSLLLH